MYAYFIDDWVYNRKHHRQMDKLDLGLTQNGISGRKFKLGRLHNIERSIEECFSTGIKTFVAVGNDETASKLLNSLLKGEEDKKKKEENQKFTFAVIPVDDSSQFIASSLGSKSLQEAIKFLAVHKTNKIDVGLINNRHYFITAAVFPKDSSLSFQSYTVSSLKSGHHISVCNSNIYKKLDIKDKKTRFDIRDGLFDAVIAYHPDLSLMEKLRSSKASIDAFIPESIFPIKDITIKNKQKTISIFADTDKQMSTPVHLEVVPSLLSVVVGHDL
jgi:diacylglycerol kinase family enzyme